MIFGIGTDIIEVARVGRELAKPNGFRERCFTPAEIAYCEARAGRARNYAARFAAKEAFLKALGTGWRRGLAFADVSVVHDGNGKPEIALTGKARAACRRRRIRRIHVSMSHINDCASAVVVMER